MDELFVVCETAIDPKNGEISINTAYGPFANHTAAENEMRKFYFAALKEAGLEDNNTCDEDGNAIPGGYITEDDAGIWEIAEYAFDQLLECVSFVIKKLG